MVRLGRVLALGPPLGAESLTDWFFQAPPLSRALLPDGKHRGSSTLAGREQPWGCLHTLPRWQPVT